MSSLAEAPLEILAACLRLCRHADRCRFARMCRRAHWAAAATLPWRVPASFRGEPPMLPPRVTAVCDRFGEYRVPPSDAALAACHGARLRYHVFGGDLAPLAGVRSVSLQGVEPGAWLGPLAACRTVSLSTLDHDGFFVASDLSPLATCHTVKLSCGAVPRLAALAACHTVELTLRDGAFVSVAELSSCHKLTLRECEPRSWRPLACHTVRLERCRLPLTPAGLDWLAGCHTLELVQRGSNVVLVPYALSSIHTVVLNGCTLYTGRFGGIVALALCHTVELESVICTTGALRQCDIAPLAACAVVKLTRMPNWMESPGPDVAFSHVFPLR
jgi:hypothetical protein